MTALKNPIVKTETRYIFELDPPYEYRSPKDRFNMKVKSIIVIINEAPDSEQRVIVSGVSDRLKKDGTRYDTVTTLGHWNDDSHLTFLREEAQSLAVLAQAKKDPGLLGQPGKLNPDQTNVTVEVQDQVVHID